VDPIITALVPMRHDSERIKGKNYRPIAGRPLFEHIVAALLDSGAVANVVIDTDSPIITDLVSARGDPRVRVIPRPQSLRDGMIPMNRVLLHDIEQAPSDYYLQTHSTNPLLKASTIAKAVEAFLAGIDSGKHDSLFGVTRWQTRLYDADAKPINHNPNKLERTQDLPPVFEENSNLYIFAPDTLTRLGRRIGDTPILFEIDRLEATDIDDQQGWMLAQALMDTPQLSPASTNNPQQEPAR